MRFSRVASLNLPNWVNAIEARSGTLLLLTLPKKISEMVVIV